MGLFRLCSLGGMGVLAAAGVAAQVAPIPSSDELSGRPYAIQKTWVIGGAGEWDYLTLDPSARQLFVAHGPTVQVVDIETGVVAGTVSGFQQAHAVVLDDQGPNGYATDGAVRPIHLSDATSSKNRVDVTFGGGVKVFDRRTFETLATILTRPSLRVLTLEPQTGLLFALGTDLSTLPPAPEPASRRRPNPTVVPRDTHDQGQTGPCGSTHSFSRMPESIIAVIDPTTRRELVDIRVCGILGSAEPDGTGGVYMAFSTRNMAARLDAGAIAQLLGSRDSAKPAYVEIAGRQYIYNEVTEWDWRAQTKAGVSYGDVLPQLRTISLADCDEPRGLAVDGKRNRLFVGCSNRKLVVLDSNSGASITSFTVGPGTDSVAYDAGRGLIFAASGGGYGSVTVIRQHVTDEYSVVQNLPTMERARTMALDPTSGMVYLVTAINGANVSAPPRTGIPGAVKYGRLDGSFQVLVVGN